MKCIETFSTCKNTNWNSLYILTAAVLAADAVGSQCRKRHVEEFMGLIMGQDLGLAKTFISHLKRISTTKKQFQYDVAILVLSSHFRWFIGTANRIKPDIYLRKMALTKTSTSVWLSGV